MGAARDLGAKTDPQPIETCMRRAEESCAIEPFFPMAENNRALHHDGVCALAPLKKMHKRNKRCTAYKWKPQSSDSEPKISACVQLMHRRGPCPEASVTILTYLSRISGVNWREVRPQRRILWSALPPPPPPPGSPKQNKASLLEAAEGPLCCSHLVIWVL